MKQDSGIIRHPVLDQFDQLVDPAVRRMHLLEPRVARRRRRRVANGVDRQLPGNIPAGQCPGPIGAGKQKGVNAGQVQRRRIHEFDVEQRLQHGLAAARRQRLGEPGGVFPGTCDEHPHG